MSLLYRFSSCSTVVNMRHVLLINLCLSCLCLPAARAALRLSGLFSDGMVLQRDRPIPISGEADGEATVTVEFAGTQARAAAAAGRWTVTLPPATPGGPYPMTISSGQGRIAIHRVYVGDVWLFTGGTDLGKGTGTTDAASVPPISLFTVPRRESETALTTTEGAWSSGSEMPTLPLAFGKALREALGVPVGLIVSAPYRCRVDAWLSGTTPELEVVERIFAYYQTDYEAKHRNWQQKAAVAARQGERTPKGRPWPQKRPHLLYNGMIAPLTSYGIRGVVWVQGNVDKFHAAYHQRLLGQLVRDWRRDWGDPELPFLLIQLPAQRKTQSKRAPTQSQFAELRDAARQVARTVPHTGLVVTADLGTPPDEARIGQRLAAVALGVAGRREGTHANPVFDRMHVTDDGVTLSFLPEAASLSSTEDPLTGLSVAAERHRFSWADGTLGKNQVALRCATVKTPVAARYGWSDSPQLCLTDHRGLPLSPFRTDDFPTLMPWDRNVTYGMVNGHALTAFLFLPWRRHPKPCPVVVFIHGGGWRSGTPYIFTWHAHRLAEKGFAALSIRYRLSQQAPFPACLEDAKCAIRWVRAYADAFGFDPERIGVVGQSAGAHIAALLATTAGLPRFEGSGGHQGQSSAVQAAVLINGVYDFRHFWDDETLHGFRTVRMCVPELIGKPFDEAPELYDAASPIRYVSRTVPPCLLFHSRPDDVVPFSEAVNLHEAIRGQGTAEARLELSDVGGHGWALGSHLKPCTEKTEAFLLEQLGPARE